MIGPHNRDHDVNDLKEIKHKAQDKQNQHHDQEDCELIVELTSGTAGCNARRQMLITTRFSNCEPNQDGEHHRRHLGRLAHNRAQNSRRGVQNIAAEQQTKQPRRDMHHRHKEGKPAFRAHIVSG